MSPANHNGGGHMTKQDRAELTLIVNDAIIRNEELKGIENQDENYKCISLGLSFIKGRLSQCIPELVSPQDFSDLKPNLVAIISELNNFIANDNANHISNIIDSYLQTSIRTTQRLPINLSENDFIEYTNTIEHHFNNIYEKINDLDQACRSSQSSLDKRFIELQEKKENLETNLYDTEEKIKSKIEQIENDLLAKLDNIKEAISQEHTNVATIGEQLKADFQESEKNRLNEHNGAINVFQEKYNRTLQSAEDQLENFLYNDAQGAIEEIEKLKSQAQNLVHIIGASGMAGGFATTAADEAKTANALRTWSIVFWIAAIGLTSWLLVLMSHSDISTAKVLGRVAAIFIFAAPASYLMVESRGHRSESRRANRYALEMAALSPYLATLDEKVRNQIIAILTGKYFGQINETAKQQEAGTIQEKVFQMLMGRVCQEKPSSE